MRWLVLSYSVTNQPSSSSRVTLWRRLQRLGALAITGAYVLPERSDCLESFTWLVKEIEAAGGEALIMKVEQFEGLDDKKLVERFNHARAEAYTDILSEIDTLEQSLDTKDSEIPPVKALHKLQRRFSDLWRIDFFKSNVGKKVAERLTELEQQLSPKPPETAQVLKANKKDYQEKTWVTRPQPHVDRLASTWLIKRFIDPKAKILYRDNVKAKELSFDMENSDFGHVGSLCTFETLIVAFSIEDTAINSLAQIVHELDLRDERYIRSEVAGLDMILNGWLALGLTDEALEQRGIQLFEGLYASLSQD